MPVSSPPNTPKSPELRRVVKRNVRALTTMRRDFELQRTFQDQIADAIARFTGSMSFVAIHLVVVGSWFVLNLRIVPWLRPWDPFPFVMLAMCASVEAIFLSTFVLITQKRMQRLAEKRADLDVQINLLAEHELTRLIELVDAVARKLGVEAPSDVRDLEVEVHPSDVLGEIERDLERDERE